MSTKVEKLKENGSSIKKESRAIANSNYSKQTEGEQNTKNIDSRNENSITKSFKKYNSNTKQMPLQMVKGEPGDPHLVDEKKYKLLSDETLGDHIVVPNVSGCAAIKINVFSGIGEAQTLISSMVMHSDATEGSIETANEIGDNIIGMPQTEKSVSILIITNAKWNSMSEHAGKVLSVISKKLSNRGIACHTNEIILTYGIGDTVNIDVTGSDEEILERYEDAIPNEEERGERVEVFKEYSALYQERSKTRRDHKRKKAGRKTKDNPDYIEALTPQEFARLDLADRKIEVARLKGELAKSSGCCFLTTACVQYKGLDDKCEELTLLRYFRDTYLINKENGKELIGKYYNIAPLIVKAIDKEPKAGEIYDSIYKVICSCVDHIKKEEYEQTFEIYKKMVEKFANDYSNKLIINNICVQ